MCEPTYNMGTSVCDLCLNLKDRKREEGERCKRETAMVKGGDDPVNGVTLPDPHRRTNSPRAKGLLCLQRSNKGEGWATHSVIIAVIFKP